MKDKPCFMIIGGDSRFSYMEKILKEKGYDSQRIFPGEYKADDFEKANVFVLPVPASRDNVNINTPLSDEQFYIGDFLRLLPKKCIIAGGMISDDLNKMLLAKNVSVFDYYKNESLTEKNAELTAEGVLGIIINTVPDAVSGLKCAVTGYGRCAKALCKKLKLLSAEATAIVRSEKSVEEANKDGFKAYFINDFASICSQFDVTVNTVPAKIIGKEILEQMKKDSLLIEIASAPFGVDFDSAKQLGINTIKAGSLPGRMSPKSAGEIICNTIINHIGGDDYGN